MCGFRKVFFIASILKLCTCWRPMWKLMPLYPLPMSRGSTCCGRKLSWPYFVNFVSQRVIRLSLKKFSMADLFCGGFACAGFHQCSFIVRTACCLLLWPALLCLPGFWKLEQEASTGKEIWVYFPLLCLLDFLSKLPFSSLLPSFLPPFLSVFLSFFLYIRTLYPYMCLNPTLSRL